MEYTKINDEYFHGTSEKTLASIEEIVSKQREDNYYLTFLNNPKEAHKKAVIEAQETQSRRTIVHINNGKFPVKKNNELEILISLNAIWQELYRNRLIRLYGGGEIRIYSEEEMGIFESIFL